MTWRPWRQKRTPIAAKNGITLEYLRIFYNQRQDFARHIVRKILRGKWLETHKKFDEQWTNEWQKNPTTQTNSFHKRYYDFNEYQSQVCKHFILRIVMFVSDKKDHSEMSDRLQKISKLSLFITESLLTLQLGRSGRVYYSQFFVPRQQWRPLL